MEVEKITIVRIRRPLRQDINEELQWFGSSLGLFNLRDKDKSCFRIFIELLKSAKSGGGMTSDELAFRLKLSRGTVVHHMKKLHSAGLSVMDRERYRLRTDRLEALVDELRLDMERVTHDLRKVAQDIDRKLGL